MDESLVFDEYCEDTKWHVYWYYGYSGKSNGWLGPLHINSVVVKGLINNINVNILCISLSLSHVGLF